MSTKDPQKTLLLDFKHPNRKKSLFKKKHATDDVHVHMLRLQFKQLQAYIALVENITNKKIELPDELTTYYKLIGNFREAKIFAKLCHKYTPSAKAILSINKEQISKEAKHLKDFYKKISASDLKEQAHKVIQQLTSQMRNMKKVELLNGIEKFVTEQEDLIKHLLIPHIVIDVSLHEVRKKIKTLAFLVSQAAPLEPVTFKHKLKAYKKLAKKIGKRNDVNQLIEYLEKLPRSGKEAELVEKIRRKEQTKKEQLIKKLRTYFSVQAVQISETTMWPENASKKKSLSTKKTSPKPSTGSPRNSSKKSPKKGPNR